VLDSSPIRNSTTDPIRLFQHGDAFDLMLSVDPEASPDRTTPVTGDFRVLFSVVRGEPVAVLYRPVAPDAPPAQRARFQSPVGSTTVEQVKVLERARVAFETQPGPEGQYYWTMTAALPWEELGVQPPASEGDLILRGDLGVLQSDPNGVETVSRIYWSGKTQTVVCDVPSETRLIPTLWGDMLFKAHDIFNLKPDDFAPGAPEADPDDLFGP